MSNVFHEVELSYDQLRIIFTSRIGPWVSLSWVEIVKFWWVGLGPATKLVRIGFRAAG